jgi:hypothetical protein
MHNGPAVEQVFCVRMGIRALRYGFPTKEPRTATSEACSFLHQFPLPHRSGVDNQALDERKTWCMLSDRDRQRQRNLCPRDRVWVMNDAQRTCCRAGLLCI